MIWSALFGQSESVLRLRSLLRLLTIITMILLVGAAYSVWRTVSALSASRLAARSLTQQTRNLVETLRQKREQLQQSTRLHLEDPAGKGNLELTDTFSQMASKAGVRIRSYHCNFADSLAVTVGTNPPSNINPTSGGTEGGVSKATGISSVEGTTIRASPEMPKSRWMQANFDYEFGGTFNALTTLLNSLTETNSIIEINSIELTRDKIGATPETTTAILRLSATIYGLPGAH